MDAKSLLQHDRASQEFQSVNSRSLDSETSLRRALTETAVAFTEWLIARSDRQRATPGRVA